MLSIIDEMYKTNILPLVEKQAKLIDNDIRFCIKEEIKKYGSIVKRYGDWSKFIRKEFERVMLPSHCNNTYFGEKIYYRNNFIGKYEIVIKIENPAKDF